MWDKEIAQAKEKTDHEKTKLEEWKKELFQVQALYSDITENRMKNLDEVIEETKQHRMDQLKELCEEAKSKYDLQLKEYEEKRLKQTEEIKESCIEAEQRYFDECNKIKADTEQMRQQYEALLEPIKQYLKEKQEKYFS